MADEDTNGKLNVLHRVEVSGTQVTICLATTRYVGTVDDDGFLLKAQQHIDQGTLAETLLLTIRARISGFERTGPLWVGETEVEVFLHKGTKHEISLGLLVGDTGIGDLDWQEFYLDVNVRNVKFPADPCQGQDSSTSCGKDVEPAANEITFELRGDLFSAEMGIVYMEVDWVMLEPKDALGLAWRPVLLVHGLGTRASRLD